MPSTWSALPPSADALRHEPHASYERAAAAAQVRPEERAVVSAQLGRPARGRSATVHRCTFGLPTTVRVDPRLDDGTPFPTVFWLTCPLARRHVGRLEAAGEMARLTDLLAAEAELAASYAAASERYVRFRDRLGTPLPGDPTAGGMPDHVKCLHVHLAHFLATGDNPVGARTYEQIAPMPCPAPCVDDKTLDAAYGDPGTRP